MTVPLAPGTVSLGLHPVARSAAEAVDDLRRDAEAAQAAGFDGVTISEHHAGAPGYFANPLLVSATLLAALRTIWVAACPVVLPLRHISGVLEDVAFLRAAFPGRFAVGVAPGWAGDDFALFDVPEQHRRAVFEKQLAVLTAVRDGQHSPAASRLLKDPLVALLASDFPVAVSAAGSLTAVRRAARAGLGLLLSQYMGVVELRRMVQDYRIAGGTGPIVLIRRFWIGTDVPQALVRMMSEQGAWVSRDSSVLLHGDGSLVSAQLRDMMDRTGVDAINMRVQFPGLTRALYEAQVARFGSEVLPGVRGG